MACSPTTATSSSKSTKCRRRSHRRSSAVALILLACGPAPRLTGQSVTYNFAQYQEGASGFWAYLSNSQTYDISTGAPTLGTTQGLITWDTGSLSWGGSGAVNSPASQANAEVDITDLAQIGGTWYGTMTINISDNGGSNPPSLSVSLSANYKSNSGPVAVQTSAGGQNQSFSVTLSGVNFGSSGNITFSPVAGIYSSQGMNVNESVYPPPALASMTPPTSGDAAITYGRSWAPSITGGTGAGAYVYCVAGYTGFQTASTLWTPPATGAYTFFVAQLASAGYAGNVTDINDGNMELNYTAYTLTVNPAPMTPPTSGNAAITYGQGWAPSITGGTGAGAYVYCVAGYTGFQTASTLWTPPATGAYTFFVAQLASAGYAGNVTDINVGNMELNYTAYTLTVNPAPAGFSASPLSFTYDGSWQGPAISPSPGGVPFSTSGTASAIDAGTYSFTAAASGNYSGSSSFTWTINPSTQGTVSISGPNSVTAGGSLAFTASGGSTGNYSWGGSSGASGGGSSKVVNFPNVGAYTVTVQDLGNGNYYPSNTASLNVAVSPIATTFSASPISFTYNGGSQGPAIAPNPGNATYSVTAGTTSATAAGTYSFTVAANGNYSGSNSFTWAIVLPQYTLSTFANGNGAVTPGGTYPLNSVLSITATPGANAYFVDWTGDISGTANPLPITMTGNLSVTANFASMQAQTISFSPPATVLFPGPALQLSASASSGLPVALSVVSGPATLSGNQLTLTGTGPVVIQANQPGNALWLPASSVTGTIQVNAVPLIARIRFNSTGLDGHTVNGGSNGSSILWTDPAGIQASPWPSFANPAPAAPVSANASLPPVPPAPSGTP